MKVETENDFSKLRKHIQLYRKKFPMFAHDVSNFENMIEHHIKEYSQLLVLHRQTRKICYLEQAQCQLNSINSTIDIIEKIELLAYLSRG
jgi:hypothetical protein